MKLRNICFLLAWLCAVLPLQARTDKAITRQVGDVNIVLQFYTPSIVRVVKYPAADRQPDKQSYSVILKPDAGKVTSAEDNGRLTLSTHDLQVQLDLSTGIVGFYTASGNLLMQEKACSFTKRHGDNDEGKYRLSQTWQVAPDELLYGLGQLRDTCMVQRGRHIDIWNHNTYISIPYITSEKGWGLYWDNPGKSYYDDNAEGTTFTSEVGLCSDYYFIYRDGTQDGVIASIRELTGQATLFPLWTMGYWQCRERYKTSDELAEVLDNYRRLQIPLDGIVQDWQYWGCDSNWNAMRFMNPYYINVSSK